MELTARLRKLKPPITKDFKKNFLIFLAVLGPGIITANVDNDAGGIATYSIAGAHFGYSFLWITIPVILLLIIVQEMSARMGAVTGKGLADLIREKFGAKITFYVMLAFLMMNMANVIAEFAGVAASLQIFGISKYISVPVSAMLVWLLVVKGTYRSVEKVFLFACLFYAAYIISGFLAKPDWITVGKELVTPNFSLKGDYLYMLVGLIGTTVAPWMQFYMQSAVVEKGIDIENYRQAKWDVYVGCIIAGSVVFFILVACAATLYPAGIKIKDAADAALALKPLAGNYCSLLFSFGLFSASLFASSVLPLSTAYYVCEGLGWEAGVDRTFSEAPHFYTLYTASIVIGVAVVLVPKFPLIPVMVFSQVINGVLLPVILLFMLILINDKELMGEFTNSRYQNSIAITATSLLTIITIALFAFGWRL